MFNFGDLFGTLGLILCVGFLLVAFLVFMVFRGLTSRNRSGSAGTMRPNDPYDVTPREQERPTYDDRDIQSSGGFGGEVPTTGRERREERPGGFGFGVDDDDLDRPVRRNPPIRRDRDDDDDDEVRSSGGFGRGS